MNFKIETRHFTFKVEDLGKINVYQTTHKPQTIHIVCVMEMSDLVTSVQHPSRTELTAELAESVIKMSENKIYRLMSNLNQRTKKS